MRKGCAENQTEEYRAETTCCGQGEPALQLLALVLPLPWTEYRGLLLAPLSAFGGRPSELRKIRWASK